MEVALLRVEQRALRLVQLAGCICRRVSLSQVSFLTAQTAANEALRPDSIVLLTPQLAMEDEENTVNFSLVCPDRTIQLRASSLKNKRQWLEAFEKAMGLLDSAASSASGASAEDVKVRLASTASDSEAKHVRRVTVAATRMKTRIMQSHSIRLAAAPTACKRPRTISAARSRSKCAARGCSRRCES